MKVKRDCRYIGCEIDAKAERITGWHCHWWDRNWHEPCHCETCGRYERDEEESEVSE